jgi:hypothetical protein
LRRGRIRSRIEKQRLQEIEQGMNRSVTHVGEEHLHVSASPSHEEIRLQLRAILHSSSFQGSKRCQQFLEYACEKALRGEIGALKERSIAVHVFGRRPETTLGDDTIVRVGAREVRKRLAQFYVSSEGLSAAVHINLPPGSYVPEFSGSSDRKSAAPQNEIAEDPVSPPLPVPRHRQSTFGVWCAVAAIIAVAGFAVLTRTGTRVNSKEQAFHLFWDPVFRSADPLLIGVGHPIVYQPSHRVTILNAQRLGPSPYPMQREIELPPDQVNGSDMVPVLNQFIGFGDMVAANETTQMLARRGQKVRVALASSFSFGELRGSNAYLIGSLTNRWTMELSQNWPFQFQWTERHDAAIRDTTSSTARQWIVVSNGDGSTADDYSLIGRVRDSPTGGLLIVAAGLKQFGTEAAGRIIADPEEFGAILAKLPPGWADRNLEILVHVRVIGNSPARPELTAWRVW